MLVAACRRVQCEPGRSEQLFGVSRRGLLVGRGWFPETPTIGAPQGRRVEIDRLDVPAAAVGTEGDYILVIGG